MDFIDSTMLSIGKMPQYFFDNVVIEQVQDLTRVVHSPKKEPGPLIKRDRPWEHVLYFQDNSWNVLRDESSGKFKCWYEDWNFNQQTYARDKKERNHHWAPLYPMRECYACSDDGLVWEKPELDYLEENGRKTNVVFGNSSFGSVHEANVLDDPLASDPQRRFVMIFERHFPEGERKVAYSREGVKERQLELAYSPDGIKWTSAKELPRFGPFEINTMEDAWILSADVQARVYRLILRHPEMGDVNYDERRPRARSLANTVRGSAQSFPHDVGRMNKRRIFQSVSSDLIHWSSPVCILTPDDQEDNLEDHYYDMAQFRLGDLHVGLLSVFHQVSNTKDVRLVYSRDGWRWYHINQRQPWLTASPGAWDARQVNSINVPIPVGDELFVYYGGAKNHHDWWITGLREGFEIAEAQSLDEVMHGLGLAKLRRDGFVSIDAGAVREGILVSRRLKTDGRRLVLNAACRKDGYIDVEVTDGQERVLTRCTRAQCDTFSGDSTQAIVTWNGKANISHNGYLRLRFFIRNASLYSFGLI